MTSAESDLLSEIHVWRNRSIDNPISEALNALDRLPGREPEAQAIIDKLVALRKEAEFVSGNIIDRKLRELRILGMK